MINFKSYEQFDHTPNNVGAFAECMDRTSKLYSCYGYLRQFPTNVIVVPDGTVTRVNHANLIETWNRIRLNTVLNNVNMT